MRTMTKVIGECCEKLWPASQSWEWHYNEDSEDTCAVCGNDDKYVAYVEFRTSIVDTGPQLIKEMAKG